jgi:hypothetical protein
MPDHFRLECHPGQRQFLNGAKNRKKPLFMRKKVVCRSLLNRKFPIAEAFELIKVPVLVVISVTESGHQTVQKFCSACSDTDPYFESNPPIGLLTY